MVTRTKAVVMSTRRNSSFLGKDTQYVKVALTLERAIVEGHLCAGSPLKSVRELASHFQVSTKVIVDALQVLQRKGLVSRQPRKGVFVSSKPAYHDREELLLFAMDHEPYKNGLVRKILTLMDSPYVSPDQNVTIRLAGTQSPSSFGNLERELLLLAKADHVDCALLLTMGFLRKDVEQALRLPFPVLFIGDFIEGDYSDLSYTRIAPTNRNASKCVVGYAAAQHYKNILYLFPEHINSPYVRSYFSEFKALASDQGLQVTPLPIPGLTYQDTTRNAIDIFRDHRELLQSTDMVASLYFEIPDPGFPLPDICYLDTLQNNDTHKQVHTSCDNLFKAIAANIPHTKPLEHARKIIYVDSDCVLMQPSKWRELPCGKPNKPLP